MIMNEGSVATPMYGQNNYLKKNLDHPMKLLFAKFFLSKLDDDDDFNRKCFAENFKYSNFTKYVETYDWEGHC